MIETMIDINKISSEDRKGLRKILLGSVVALGLMLGALTIEYAINRGVNGMAKDFEMFCEGARAPYSINLNIDYKN